MVRNCAPENLFLNTTRGTMDSGPAPSGASRNDDLPPLLLLRRLLAVGVALGRAGQDLFGDQAGVLADRGFDLGGHVRVGLEERFGVLTALPQTLAVIGEPGAG